MTFVGVTIVHRIVYLDYQLSHGAKKQVHQVFSIYLNFYSRYRHPDHLYVYTAYLFRLILDDAKNRYVNKITILYSAAR